MTTTTRHPVDSTTRTCCGAIGGHSPTCAATTCPDYCQADPTQMPCDWWDRDGQPIREHAGPTFGPIYTTYIEHRDGSVTREALCLVDQEPKTAAVLEQHAAHALAAAAWLRADR